MSVNPNEESSVRLGAYGLALDPNALSPRRLGPVGPSGDDWTIVQKPHGTHETGAAFPETSLPFGFAQLDLDHARIETIGPTIHVDRATRTAVVEGDQPISSEHLAHPCLAPIACAAAYWAGGVSLHAGAVVLGGQAWGVLGDRRDGKTTLMAALDQAGHPVLTDDLLVLDADLTAHVGPRLIDLRPQSAELFPDAIPLADIPGRPRLRLTPGPAPATAPLAGFVRLVWSEYRLGLTPIAPVDRVPLVASALTIGAPLASPFTALDLAALPMYALERPHDLAQLGASVDAVTALATHRP